MQPWQMEPLIKRAGQTDVELVIGNDEVQSLSMRAPGFIRGVLAGPVDVTLELGASGEGEDFEEPVVTAME